MTSTNLKLATPNMGASRRSRKNMLKCFKIKSSKNNSEGCCKNRRREER